MWVGAYWPEAEAWRIERRAKYVADGAAHALLLAATLYYAQSVVRGWRLVLIAAAGVYGMLHGLMQAACGYAAYFTARAAVRGAGGLCERAAGWEPVVMALACAIALAVIIETRHGNS